MSKKGSTHVVLYCLALRAELASTDGEKSGDMPQNLDETGDRSLPEIARRQVIGITILDGLHHNYRWVA